MYKLKEHFDDFIVEELLARELLVDKPTMYHVFLLEKQNYTTERAVRAVAQALKLPRKAVSYAGTKDKQAITKQYIVIKGSNKDKVATIDLKDIKLSFIGYTNYHLKLGDLAGNTFTIAVRNLDAKVPTPLCSFYVPNYFDEQRFSTANVQLGLLFMKKDFAGATTLLQEFDDDFKELVASHLAKSPNDHVGALRLLPRKILLFYVHAVQSKIYNDLLATDLRTLTVCSDVPYSQGVFAFPKEPLVEVTQKDILLPGFASDDVDTFLQENYNLTSRQFLIPSIPELSLEGSTRLAYSHITNCTITYADDELHAGKKKAIVSFNLKKGSYATIVIRQLFAKK